MKPLFTLGYQRVPLSRLVEIVNELNALLVDCRLYPRSSWNPDYNRSSLESVFKERYVWKGRDLGGYGHTTTAGIRWNRKEREGRTLLLMCVEHDPKDCHRHLTICGPHFPDALHLHGTELILASDLEAKLRR